MPGACTLAIVMAAFAWGSVTPAGRPLDRDALLAALQQRAATGVPAHLNHDEGEDLQAAVTAALAAYPGDDELAWAATRGSFAAVARTRPAIYDAPPAVSIHVLAPLSLPWRVVVTGAFDVSLDGSAWRRAADFKAGTELVEIPLQKIFQAAGRPGFHVVRVRAALRFNGVPASLPTTEMRDLPACTYGVTGTSAAGQRVAAFLGIPTGVIASSLDASLPSIPLDTWLRTVAVHGESPAPFWTAQWCEDRPGVSEQATASLCARSMIGSAPNHGHGEVWLKIATVDLSADRPAWTAVIPTLEGVDLFALPARSTVALRDLPLALRAAEEDWPHPALTFDARTVDLLPANPRPGEPVTIRAEVRNSGNADLYGMTIDVLAFDTRERDPRVHRRFVRSIPAGESVTVETSAAFPLGYGGVVVTVLPLTQETGFPPLMAAESKPHGIAARLVRPDLAPPGYADLVRATVGCASACTAVR